MTLTGRFITIEGGEGTGKSTLIAGLSNALRQRGLNVLTTREPGGTPLAEEVRELALKKREGQGWSPVAMALMMNAARDDHLNRQIRPALRAGHWILCDRFADSTRVYQGIDGVSDRLLKALEAGVVADTQPDLTLILDGAPDDLLTRRSHRGISDVFEERDLAFHENVRSRFLEIAEQEFERCSVLNALNTPDAVLASALAALQEKVGLP